MKKLKSSIDHFTGRERRALHGIRRELSAAVDPLLVLYLGSLATTVLRRNLSAVERHHATDFRLSCELLVVAPAGSGLPGDGVAVRALEDRLSAYADVRLAVMTREELVRQLSSGRNGKINLHSKAIVLYEREGMLQRVVDEVGSVGPRVVASAAPRKDGCLCCNDASVSVLPLRDDGGLLRFVRIDGGLSAEERADPMSVLVSFYRMYDLPEVRMRIAVWMQAVVSAPSWPVAETGRHLDFYVALCRMVWCAWLLRGCRSPEWVPAQLQGVGEKTLPPQWLYCPHEGADAWVFFPHHLSREEFGAPGAVFSDLFSVWSPSDWLERLYELFSFSLTDCTPAEVGADGDPTTMGEALHRLAEAAHLLAVWERHGGAGSSLASRNQEEGAARAGAVVTSVL